MIQTLSDNLHHLPSGTRDIVKAIEAGLLAQHGYIAEQDVVFELLSWMEKNEHSILREIYAQALEYVISKDYVPSQQDIAAHTEYNHSVVQNIIVQE
ncbi:hypothetical protein [Buttiauxella sp.]|uniref:hypothetical protein n=1 Tax=Buttiauxella sp. TaxID=1972222 RepID=UPI003C740266